MSAEADLRSAQATPPTYIVVDIGETTDAAAWGAVVANAPNPPSGYLVRTQKAVQLDGAAAAARFVVKAVDPRSAASGQCGEAVARHPIRAKRFPNRVRSE
jgi:hypothetical protein